MTGWTFALQSLRFYWRSQLGVAAGVAVAAAVLTGALAVGDSVRFTLRRLALQRIGQMELVMAPADRFFEARLAEATGEQLKARASAALMLRGVAIEPATQRRVNDVQVVGVDQHFWSLAHRPPDSISLKPDHAAISDRLAEQLDLGLGDDLLIRFDRPSALSRDAPLSSDADATVATWVTITQIMHDDQFGRFSLQADQVPALNVFVDRRWLGQISGQPGMANVLMLGAGRGEKGGSPTDPLTVDQADQALADTWRLADANLELRRIEQPGTSNQLELRSGRVFLDPPIAEAAGAVGDQPTGVLSYFVNALEGQDRSTPYSMVAAMDRLPGGMPLGDDQVAISRWLADDLQIGVGDQLTMRYFVLGPMRKLTERSAAFEVAAVLPMNSPAVDPTLMPPFPGLHDSENCRDWEPGFPIDLDRIRDKDEQYWDQYRGSPKAFVALQTGQRLWANRFGDLTAVRWPADANQLGQLSRSLRQAVDIRQLGLFFEPVRSQALSASAASQDFGGLFIGFSFFLIVAAALLTVLLFTFNLEQRTSELGLLKAVGFRASQVRRLQWREGLLLAVIGSALGTAAGLVYAAGALGGLNWLWPGAVINTSVTFFVSWQSLLIGGSGTLVVAGATIGLIGHRLVRQPAARLLVDTTQASSANRLPRLALVTWLVGTVAVAALLAWAAATQRWQDPGLFFATGGAALGALVGMFSLLLWWVGRSRRTVAGLVTLAWRNATRRRGRSVATVALLACGAFGVIAVGAFRFDLYDDPADPKSSTGGFALFASAAVPIHRDLNAPQTRQRFGLTEQQMDQVKFVPLRLRPGDDASCRNLNRPQNPPLLGVPVDALAGRGAFTFVNTSEVAGGPADPWRLLGHYFEDGAVPAFADAETAQWALGIGLGQTLQYTDQQGKPFKVRLVGTLHDTVLQGTLLIDERRFVERFPASSGYRWLLIDAPFDRVGRLVDDLSAALADHGTQVMATTDRLARFHEVKNAYLSIFQAIGGLGLLLGSVGVGIVAGRNILERRAELATLRAVGFGVAALRGMLLIEHGLLVVAGLTSGAVAAGLAVLPTILTTPDQLPWISLGVTLLGVLICATGVTAGATRMATGGSILQALRNE